jgi:zinc protease
VFTADRSPRTIHHQGRPTRASSRWSWPTHRWHDLRSALTRDLLAAVIQLRLIEKLREELGATLFAGVRLGTRRRSPTGFGYLTVAGRGGTGTRPSAGGWPTIRGCAPSSPAGPVGDDLILRARPADARTVPPGRAG